jgi:hypothetical protein
MGNEGHPPACSAPIDAAVLADYWLAKLKGAEEEPVEEHLLACDRCGERLREVIALAEGVRELACEGSLRMIVSDAFLKRAAAEGLRVRQYEPPVGGSVECTVTAEDDILIARLAADLSGAKRVDLCMCDDRGVEQFRLPDIPVHSGTSGVVYQESITLMKAAPTSKIIARLVTFDEAGGERLLGEYTFNHTRTLPGPGAQQ